MNTSKHIFNNVCIDFDALLATTDIKKMFKVAAEQAKTEEAKKRTDFANYKDYGQDEWSPMYFGLFVEWFAEHFLNHFGHMWNICDVQLFNHEGDATEDLGVDGMAKTQQKRKAKGTRCEAPQFGDVYIQVKGTLNYFKEHKANDGSRLPNFTTNAMSSAIMLGRAYQSRYMLFTTASGVHYTLQKMWNDMVEVISIKEINKFANGNVVFLNLLRKSVGLDPIEFSQLPMDSEAAYNVQENEHD